MTRSAMLCHDILWWGKEIYDQDTERRRECLYYLALGHYRLGEYSASRQFNQLLLDSEPDNMQALSLHQLIADRVQRGIA